MNSYKARYRDLKEKEFIINHSLYKTYSKEVYVENNFYQYIIYINSGPEHKFGVSVALNINNNEVDKLDLGNFKQIVKSIVVKK